MNGASAAPNNHERRSWHYPSPWMGVEWQPAPAPIRDATAFAWAALNLLTYVACWVAAGGALMTSVAAAAVMIAGG